MHTLKSPIAFSLAILALTVTAGPAQGAGSQAGQIAFVGGKVEHCRMGARKQVFRQRLQAFSATDLSISADGKLLVLAGRRTRTFAEARAGSP